MRATWQLYSIRCRDEALRRAKRWLFRVRFTAASALGSRLLWATRGVVVSLLASEELESARLTEYAMRYSGCLCLSTSVCVHICKQVAIQVRYICTCLRCICWALHDLQPQSIASWARRLETKG